MLSAPYKQFARGSTRYVPQLHSRASPHPGPHSASLVRLLHQPPRFVTGRNSRSVSSWTPFEWHPVICDITTAHLVLPTGSITSIRSQAILPPLNSSQTSTIPHNAIARQHRDQGFLKRLMPVASPSPPRLYHRAKRQSVVSINQLSIMNT